MGMLQDYSHMALRIVSLYGIHILLLIEHGQHTNDICLGIDLQDVQFQYAQNWNNTP